MLIALISAGFFDSLFKINENDGLKFSGITFYGGLLGGALSMLVMLWAGRKQTSHCIGEWFNIMTQPLIILHIFGRIGCFFAGCCYGKVTESVLGVRFPDIETANIFHHGEKCYPTQLIEAFALIIILIVVNYRQNKFFNYLAMYAVLRFIIEFFRGDLRGEIFGCLSPAQVISIIILLVLCGTYFRSNLNHDTT